MKRGGSGVLLGGFVLLVFLTIMEHPRPRAWAQAPGATPTAVTPAGGAGASREQVPRGTVPLPQMPALSAHDVPLAVHDELAMGHGLSLTYKAKGLDPTANQLVVQAQARDGAVVYIDPERWLPRSPRTFVLAQPGLAGAVAVRVLSSTHPISWVGEAGVWVVNATNTGVNLVAPNQAITTALAAGPILIGPGVATLTVTFLLRATPKLAAQWGAVYPTQLTVYNGCPGASWPQHLATRAKFSVAVASAAVTTAGPVPWDLRHVDGSGLILAAGTVSAPICGPPPVPPPPGARAATPAPCPCLQR